MLFALAELIYYAAAPLKREGGIEGGRRGRKGWGDFDATDERDSDGGGMHVCWKLEHERGLDMFCME